MLVALSVPFILSRSLISIECYIVTTEMSMDQPCLLMLQRVGLRYEESYSEVQVKGAYETCREMSRQKTASVLTVMTHYLFHLLFIFAFKYSFKLMKVKTVPSPTPKQ